MSSKIREILASGGLSLLFTPKRQPTTKGGDASCQTDEQPPTATACSPAPSSTGGGAEDLIGRLLCRLGRHDWQLLFVQSHGGGLGGRWIGSTYQCWRCPARRTERTP